MRLSLFVHPVRTPWHLGKAGSTPAQAPTNGQCSVMGGMGTHPRQEVARRCGFDSRLPD